MSLEKQIAASLIGKSLHAVELREHDWVFTFADNVGLVVPCLWRVVQGERIVLCRDDHAQQFGLPAPLDGTEEAKKHLAGKVISAVSVRKQTGDLTIAFAGDTFLELLTDSGGYEGWRFWITDGLQVVVLGGGELSYWTDDQKSL